MHPHHFQTHNAYDSGSDDDDSTDSTLISMADSSIIEHGHIDEYDLDVSDRIYYSDQHFLDEPKEHGHYYLGTVNEEISPHNLLDISVSSSTFYQFSFNDILRYLRFYSVHWRNTIPTMDILQLDIVQCEYQVIRKTYWLRLVQRHWRSVFKQQQKVIQIRKSMANIRYREIYGRNMYGGNSLPRLHGMLSVYANLSRCEAPFEVSS